MVMLAKYLLIELSSCHPRVIIVTDRKELDRQIAATFSHTRLNPARAPADAIWWTCCRMAVPM